MSPLPAAARVARSNRARSFVLAYGCRDTAVSALARDARRVRTALQWKRISSYDALDFLRLRRSVKSGLEWDRPQGMWAPSMAGGSLRVTVSQSPRVEEILGLTFSARRKLAKWMPKGAW